MQNACTPARVRAWSTRSRTSSLSETNVPSHICDEKKKRRKKTSCKQPYQYGDGPTRWPHVIQSRRPNRSYPDRGRPERQEGRGRPRDSDGPAASPIRHPTARTALPDLSARSAVSPRPGRPPGAAPETVRESFGLIRAVRPETDGRGTSRARLANPVCPRGGPARPTRHHEICPFCR